MADMSVPVSDQYNNGMKGPEYGATAGIPTASQPRPTRTAHRSLHLLRFFLLLLTAMATAAALTTIYKSNQTVGGARARWNDFASFKFFLVANAIVLSYATLAALASLLGVVSRRGPLSAAPIAWLTFVMEFLLANGLMAAAASATTIAWIGRRGQLNAGWPSQCGVVGGFCRRVLGALIACYIGWVLLSLATLLAAAAIHRQRQRHSAVAY